MKLFSFKSMSKSFVRQTIFSALAVVLFLILGFVVIYSTTYIVKNSESALDISVDPAPTQRFDLQRYEELQIVKQRKTQ